MMANNFDNNEGLRFRSEKSTLLKIRKGGSPTVFFPQGPRSANRSSSDKVPAFSLQHISQRKKKIEEDGRHTREKLVGTEKNYYSMGPCFMKADGLERFENQKKIPCFPKMLLFGFFVDVTHLLP